MYTSRYIHLHGDSQKRQGIRIPVAQYVQVLSRYLRGHITAMVLLGFLMFSTVAVQLVNPQIVRGFIDAARGGEENALLLKRAALFFALALLVQLLRIGTNYLGQVIGWTSTNDLRADVAEHCLRLDMSFHNKHASGELIQRIDGNIALLSHFFSEFVVDLVGSLLFAVGVVAVLFREDWRIGCTFLVYAVLALVVFSSMRNVAIPSRKRYQEHIARHSGFIQEHLSALEDVRAVGARPKVLHSYLAILPSIQVSGERSNVMGQLMANASQVMFAVGNAAACAIGAWVFLRGTISIGTVYLIFNYVTVLVIPLQRIATEIQSLQSAGAAIARTQELLDLSPAVTGGVRAEAPSRAPSVGFHSVDFGYDEAKRIISEVSFEISPGRIVGLLGRTGSGKTTLSRLLFRFYEPQGGHIEIDGVDLRDFRLDVLRSAIGLVTQDVQLFRASLRDNITFFDRTVMDARIQTVLRELELEAWYRSLPDGLDTVLGSERGGVSSGEAQLVAFARVFLRDPRIIILDEASSRLDPATERLIESAVERLVEGRTTIVIAHRLATVSRVDDIIILEDGRVLEMGPRQILAANPSSRFSNLLRVGLEEVLA